MSRHTHGRSIQHNGFSYGGAGRASLRRAARAQVGWWRRRTFVRFSAVECQSKLDAHRLPAPQTQPHRQPPREPSGSWLATRAVCSGSKRTPPRSSHRRLSSPTLRGHYLGRIPPAFRFSVQARQATLLVVVGYIVHRITASCMTSDV